MVTVALLEALWIIAAAVCALVYGLAGGGQTFKVLMLVLNAVAMIIGGALAVHAGL